MGAFFLVIFALILFFLFIFMIEKGYGLLFTLGIVVLAFFVAVLVHGLSFKLSDTEDAGILVSEEQVDVVAVGVDDGLLSVQQLLSEYQANEVAADLKYRGKRFAIKGRVVEIRKGMLGGILVDLATSDKDIKITASFDKELEAFVAKLSKGDRVILECTSGGFSFGKPSLRECTSE